MHARPAFSYRLDYPSRAAGFRAGIRVSLAARAPGTLGGAARRERSAREADHSRREHDQGTVRARRSDAETTRRARRPHQGRDCRDWRGEAKGDNAMKLPRWLKPREWLRRE